VAALGLLAFLLRFATEEERAAIAEDPGPVPFLIVSTREPGSEQARLEVRALRAARARTAILARLLATAPLPRATARDPATMRRTEFDLESLRGNEDRIRWPAGDLDIPPRGYRPAVYRPAIEVEAEAGEAPVDLAQERTGAPGRPAPTTMSLIEREFEARVLLGLLAGTLAEEARQLHQWAVDNHPGRPAPSLKTIENRLRKAYREKAPK
jgi:hypothetical protein